MGDSGTDLEQALKAFDGKAVTILGEARVVFGNAPDYLDMLITLSGSDQPNVSSGATWLVKAYLQDGGPLSDAQTDQWLAYAPRLENWQAMLHMCQSLQFLNLEGRGDAALVEWLKSVAGHERPFLRAWALDGLVQVATAHPQFRKSAETALKSASCDPAASVRARSRNLAGVLDR